VAGQSSSIPSGPFSWKHIARSSLAAWEPGIRFDYVAGTHDGYARLTPPAAHTRAVLALKHDYWIIHDCVRTAGDHEVQIHLQFPPDIAVEALSPAGVVARWDDESLDIKMFGQSGLVRVVDSWVSRSFGALRRTRSCDFAVPGQGSRDVVTFLFPRG